MATPVTRGQQVPSLTTAAAAALAICGTIGWAAPEAMLEAYGFPVAASPAAMLRQASAWQLVSALVLLAGLEGAKGAAVAALALSAVCTLACIPVNDFFGKPRSQGVGSVVLLLFLGKLTSSDKLTSHVASGVLLVTGLLIHLMPHQTAELYEFSPETLTPLTLSLLGWMGATLVCTGVYVAALANGLEQKHAFVGAMACGAALAFKWCCTEADPLGVPGVVGLAWGFGQVGLASLALKP